MTRDAQDIPRPGVGRPRDAAGRLACGGGRDGVTLWSLAEVEPERRAGYAWLGPFAKRALKEYAEWTAKRPEVTAP